MATRRITSSLTKRTAFSSAFNVIPNEVAGNTRVDHVETPTVKAYSEVPGPKALPLIGNSWRFAPLIGEFRFFMVILRWSIFV